MKSLLLSCLPLVAAVDPLVDLGYSKYLGSQFSNGVSQWLGVRFAAPPVGDLRFAAPVDPVHTNETVVADTFGDICLGTGSAPSNTSSEDCLFLNVFAPSNASCSKPVPVFFFIQGGGFNSNSNANYNGSGLVVASNHDMIVVNINYRVGPYGFLAAEEVPSINNGLKDQLKALEWIRKHISKFGGDPNHVVIAGDSAGAASVTLLLTAYNGKDMGLFHASAAESQSFAAVRNVEDSQFMYDNLVIRTDCASSNDTLACLRSLNATYLQTKNINTPFPGAQNPPLYMYGPTLDNDVITDYTYAAFAKGNFVKVPAIYGDDTNEGTVFTPMNTSSIGASDTFLKDQFPDLTLAQLKKINELYPKAEQFPNSGAYWRQVSNAYGDIRYICPGMNLSDVYSEMKVDVWNYHWNVIDPPSDASGKGVTHTVEVNALFGPENVNGGAPASYSTINAPIVPVIQAYWTSFTRSFNPNTYKLASSPDWDQWTVEGAQRLRFQTNDTAMEMVGEEARMRCAYLSSIGVDLKQ